MDRRQLSERNADCIELLRETRSIGASLMLLHVGGRQRGVQTLAIPRRVLACVTPTRQQPSACLAYFDRSGRRLVDATASADHCFWLGSLNYQLDLAPQP